MNLESRWKTYFMLGAGAFALGLYAAWKTRMYFDTSGDATGTALFGCVAVCLLLVAGLHWFMAAGFKIGRVDLATGSLAAATLQKGGVVVVASANVQLVRKLDADNHSLSADERYVFFICTYRPWICKESQFKIA